MNYLQRQKRMLVSSLVLAPLVVSAQNDSIPVKRPTRNIAWFTPCGATKINGVAVGFFQALNVNKRLLTINGINADLGFIANMSVPFFIFSPVLSKKKVRELQIIDTTSVRVNGLSLSWGGEIDIAVNGINLAFGVTAGSDLNGISVTGVFSKCNVFRGICISGMNNIAVKGVGIQIGLVNYCKDLKGIQLGLWNKSGKRGLPLINWGI
jgi:hypothetical protein